MNFLALLDKATHLRMVHELDTVDQPHEANRRSWNQSSEGVSRRVKT